MKFNFNEFRIASTKWLALELAESLKTHVWSVAECERNFDRGVLLGPIPDVDTPVFFDWLSDNKQNVIGVELHMFESHAFQEEVVKQIQSVDYGSDVFINEVGFLILRFDKERQNMTATPLGREAWGEIAVLRRNSGHLLFLFGLDAFLSHAEVRSIVSRVESNDASNGNVITT
jgi:hypothetical protein